MSNTLSHPTDIIDALAETPADLAELRRRCDWHHIQLVADETRCGLARTGRLVREVREQMSELAIADAAAAHSDGG